MPVCGKSLSFAQPLQSPCPGSGHFHPQKSSLSPPEVAISAPQSGHLEAKTTVGNLKDTARKKADRGKMPPLHTRRGGGNPWFYPETPVVPRWKDRRSRLFRRIQEQALLSPQPTGFQEDSEALAGFKARGCPPSRRSPSFRAAAQGMREKPCAPGERNKPRTRFLALLTDKDIV